MTPRHRIRPTNCAKSAPRRWSPRDDSWQQPSDRLIERLRPAVEPVLAAFLTKYNNLFELTPNLLLPALPTLELQSFQVGRFYQLAHFTQSYNGRPLLDGDLAMLLDANWNVVSPSRMVMDPPKLAVDETLLISRQAALATALAAAADLSGKPTPDWTVISFALGVDPLRRHLVYTINLVILPTPEYDVTVKVVHARPSPQRGRQCASLLRRRRRRQPAARVGCYAG